MAERSRRGFLSLAGTAAVGAVAAACGSSTGRAGTPPPSTASSAPAAPPLPRLQQWYHAYGEDGVQDAVKRYAAAYSKAKISVQWNPGDYDSKIKTALQNSAVPDLFEAQVKIDWVRQNQVVALDDIISPVKDDFSPSVLAAQTVDGKVYGIPQATDTQVLFYRKSLLRAAGVQPPLKPTNEREFRTAARRPKFSALSNVKMESLGIEPMPPLEQAIGLYLLARNRKVGAGTHREVSPSA